MSSATSSTTSEPKPTLNPTRDIEKLLIAEENLFNRLLTELSSNNQDDNLKFACLLIFNRLNNLHNRNKLSKNSLVEFYKLISLEFVVKLFKHGEKEEEKEQERQKIANEKLHKAVENSGSSLPFSQDRYEAFKANWRPPQENDFVNLALQILTSIFNLQLSREGFMDNFGIDRLLVEDKNLLVRRFPAIFMDRVDYYVKNEKVVELVYYWRGFRGDFFGPDISKMMTHLTKKTSPKALPSPPPQLRPRRLHPNPPRAHQKNER